MQHGTHTAGFTSDPEQEQEPDNQHKWRSNALQKLDGFNAAPDDEHVHSPKEEKAKPRTSWQTRGAGPDDPEHRVNGLTADPGLDAEPPASHPCPQTRGHGPPA